MTDTVNKVLIGLAVRLAKDALPELVTKAPSSILGKFESEMSGVEAVRSGNRFTLFIQVKIRSLEDSTLLIDGITTTVKHEIKKREGGCCNAMMAPMAASLIAPMASSFIQSVASLLINVIS